MISEEEDLQRLALEEDIVRKYEEEISMQQHRLTETEYAAQLDDSLAGDACNTSGMVNYSALLEGLALDSILNAAGEDGVRYAADDDDLAMKFDGELQLDAMLLMDEAASDAGGSHVSGMSSPQ